MVKVNGTAKLLQSDEDVEVPIFAQLADYLSSDVYSITVDDDGLLTGVSTDPEEDDTLFTAYLPFSILESLAGSCTIAGPVGCFLVVDDVVDLVLLDVVQFLVGRGGDDCRGACCFG